MRVCFIAPLADVLFKNASRGVFGGSEIRAWTLARHLGRIPGFEPIIIVQGREGEQIQQRDDVRIVVHDFSAPAANPGVLTRIRSAAGFGGRHDLGAALSRLNPDVVCAFGAVGFNAQLAERVRAMRRAFVLLLGSDIDVAGSLEDVAAGRPLDGLGPRPDARMALVSADLVVAQTSWQAQRVADATGRPAALVPSPIDLADATGPAGDADHAEVLWIGKADGIKRPDLALEVARRCPDLPFRIVANRVNESMFDQLASRAPANVMLVDHVAYERIGDVFRRARVLLNTSSFEGFPNAFLQAGKYGVPIVTAVVDPDGFLQRNGCGIVAGEEPEAIASAIRALAGGAQWRQRSAKIRAYVEQNHDAARCTAMLAEHLRRLVPACQFPATRLATA